MTLFSSTPPRYLSKLIQECIDIHHCLSWNELPYSIALQIRSAVTMGLSLLSMPTSCCPIRAQMEGLISTMEDEKHAPELHIAERLCTSWTSLGACPWQLPEGSGQKLYQIAPALLGGISWMETPSLAFLARRAIIHSLSSHCADRLIDGACMFKTQDQSVLLDHQILMSDVQQLFWPPLSEAPALNHLPLYGEPYSGWPIIRACQAWVVQQEQQLLFNTCPPPLESPPHRINVL